MILAKNFHTKRLWPALLCLLLLAPARQASAFTIQELLEAASHHPDVEASELASTEGALREEQAAAALYPRVSLFGKAEAYNSPTNLRPMPPTEVNVAAGDAIPFSREIVRYGLAVEAPLYVAKVYRLREKLRYLAEKSVIASRVNLISRQAAVVSLASGYRYLSQLREAVDARLKSLAATGEAVRLKVANGRAAEAELMRIDNSVIALNQQQNDLALKILDVQRDLTKFTGLEVQEPVQLTLAEAPGSGELIGLKLEEAELQAQKKEVERAQAGRYPTLSLYGTISGNDGMAYNTDEHVSRAYNFAGLVVTVPLFDRTVSADEQLARIGECKAEKKLADTRIELTALEKNLTSRLPVVEAGLALAERGLANDVQLLEIARVSFGSGRMSSEEYLRYEAQVLEAQAAVAKNRDEQWQIRAKQAVIHGIDLRGVVK